MTYNPGAPTGSVPLNQDYLTMQQNFTQIANQWDEDHVPLTSTSGTPPNGYHKAIHTVPVSTTASNPPKNQPINGYTATPGYGQLLSAEINDGFNTDEALYFLTGGNLLMQLTSNILPSATQNGYTFLPGGILMQWGTFNASGTSGTLTYMGAGVGLKDFPNACFLVILQGDDGTVANENLLVTARPKTGFSYKSMNSGKKYTFLAIGN